MPLVGDRGDKRYKHFVQEHSRWHYATYTSIRDKYHLDIPDGLCYQQAKQRAIAEADAHFQVFSDAFEGDNLISFIANILGAIMGIASAVLAPTNVAVSIASITSSTLGGVSSIVGGVAQSIMNTNAQYAQKLYTQESSALKSAQRLSQIEHHTTSAALIYAPYSILANGSVYKEENPGSLGTPANKAPECMAGILGTKQPNLLSAQMNNSAHKHLAGNAQYDALGLPFPQAEFQNNAQRTLESIKANLDHRMRELEAGFKELLNEYFGAFEESMMLEKLFNEHTKKDIVPRIRQYNNHLFLEQNQYYRRGERLPLFARPLEYPQNLALPGAVYKRGGAIEVTNPTWPPLPKYAKTYYVDFQGKVLGHIVGRYSNADYKPDYKEERLAMALFERKQIATPPPKSQEVLDYLKGDLANLDIEQHYRALECYKDYLMAYWECFEVVIYGCVFDELRPYHTARLISLEGSSERYKEKLKEREVGGLPYPAHPRDWEKYDVGRFNENALNHDFNAFFFNSITQEAEALSKEEQEKKAIFESFVEYHRFKEEGALFEL